MSDMIASATPDDTTKCLSPADRLVRELRADEKTHPAPCWYPYSTGCTCYDDPEQVTA